MHSEFAHAFDLAYKSANSFGTMPLMSTMWFASRRFVCTAVQMLRSIKIMANNGVLPCDCSTAQTLTRELQIVHSKAGHSICIA